MFYFLVPKTSVTQTMLKESFKSREGRDAAQSELNSLSANLRCVKDIVAVPAQEYLVLKFSYQYPDSMTGYAAYDVGTIKTELDDSKYEHNQ